MRCSIRKKWYKPIAIFHRLYYDWEQFENSEEKILKRRKSNKLITVLVILAVLSVAAAGGMLAYIYYQNTHIFVEGQAYPLDATYLDLREEDISFAHFDAVQSQLPGCTVVWNVPFQGKKVSSDSAEITISNPSSEDIRILGQYFPKLRTINAGGCDNYETLEQMQAALPQVKVAYQIALGGSFVDPAVTELDLEPGDYDLDTLKEALLYLRQVTDVTIHKLDLTLEQFQTLREAFPEITFHYTVYLLDQEQSSDVTALDLSRMQETDLDQVARKLSLLPELETVELCGSDGTSKLTEQEAKTLIAAAPDAVFHYAFDFYGQTLSTDMEEVKLKGLKISDDEEQTVRDALDLLSNCKRFVLEDCGLSNETLAKLRDDYRDRTKIVWRVYFGKGSSLTDVQVIRCVYDLKDSNCSALRYCEDAVYADFGHDEYLNDSSFLEGMTSLEVVILSGSPIKDLTPLANCKNLRILEIANCGYVTDLSPLAACEKLEMLNISYTKAGDLAPLENLPLTHLVAVGGTGTRLGQEQQEAFETAHPDCQNLWRGTQEYGVGWRYVDKETEMDWYAQAAVAFKYPHAPNNVGWYLTTND